MVAYKEVIRKEGEATMQEKVRDEIVNAFKVELKELVQNLLESLVREERAMYLDAHPATVNSYYTRDLLTRAGPLEDLKDPRVWRGYFHPRSPYRKVFYALQSISRLIQVTPEQVKAWWARSLIEECYAMFLDGLFSPFVGKRRPGNSCASP